MKHNAGFVFLELIIAISICSMLLFLTVVGVVRLCRGSLAISTWIWTAAGDLLFPIGAIGIINVIGEARLFALLTFEVTIIFLDF
jgi:hypothetical protein